jgi:hypothetical protein
MFPDTLNKIAGYSDIERTISFAGKNIGAGLFAHTLTLSFPRRRESIDLQRPCAVWIPACAGMTKGNLEMMRANAEMAQEKLGTVYSFKHLPYYYRRNAQVLWHCLS